MSGRTNTQHILDALCPAQQPSQWLNGFAPENWDDLVVRAIVLGLAPQLYHRLSQWEVKIPARPFAKLQLTYQAQQKRNEAILAQLAEILMACAAKGITPLALKGVHLAAHWYAQPALRPMNDIDLLFQPAEMDTVAQIFAALGYEGHHKSADLGPGVTKHTSTYRRPTDAAGQTPNPYLSAAAGRIVEPHTSLEESWFGLKVDITPGVRERAITLPFGNCPGRALSNEDLLLHLCLHFCFHLIQGAPTMVQLSDLGLVGGSGRIDWQTFTGRAIANQAAPYALAGLSLAQKLLQAPIPAEPCQTLRQATPRSLAKRIANLSLDDVLRRSQQKPLTTIPQRIQRGLQDRAETARWAPNWRGRWQVWRTALKIGQTDTGRMLLK